MQRSKILGGIALASMMLVVLTGCPGIIANQVSSSQEVQSAIDNAAPGDTVTVFGSHDEDVTVNKEGVTLEGEGDAEINGNVNVDADNVKIRNIRITGNLETATFGSFEGLSLENATVYGETLNKTLDCAAVVNRGDAFPDRPQGDDGTICVATEDVLEASTGTSAAGLASTASSTATVTGQQSCDATVSDGESIQDAIDTAGDGDTICVESGTYEESVTIDTANVTLQSTDGAGVTTIEAPDEANDTVWIEETGLGEITIEGFTVKGGNYSGITHSSNGHDGTTVHVLNNILEVPDGGWSGHGNSIQVSGDGSTVIGNEVEATGYDFTGSEDSATGILVNGASNALIENNYVEYVDEGVGEHYRGISVGATYIDYFEIPPAEGIQVKNNTVVGLERGIAVTGHAVDTLIRNNDVENNDIGIASESFEVGDPGDYNHGVPSGTEAHYNNIVGNDIGAESFAENLEPERLDALDNWWGDSSGPSGEGPGSGDAVGENVDFTPWLVTIVD